MEYFLGLFKHAQPNALQNNKVQISLGRVELFRLFVAGSYTSVEVAVLSCRFS